MRDGINLTKAGRPAIVFVHHHFERAARAQAKGLGMPDLRLYVYQQYTPGVDSLRHEDEKAVVAAGAFGEMLK